MRNKIEEFAHSFTNADINEMSISMINPDRTPYGNLKAATEINILLTAMLENRVGIVNNDDDNFSVAGKYFFLADFFLNMANEQMRTMLASTGDDDSNVWDWISHHIKTNGKFKDSARKLIDEMDKE